jgi:putative transposase
MEDAPMTSDNVIEPEPVEVAEPQRSLALDQQLIDELEGRAQAEGLQLTGEGGLLQQLTKRLLESALEGEVTDHLGYDRHDPAGKNGGNSRNGTRHKRRTLTKGGKAVRQEPNCCLKEARSVARRSRPRR